MREFFHLYLVSSILAACGGGGDDAATPDAAAPDAPFLPGNWSCRNTPWPTAAADPLTIKGKVVNSSGNGTNFTPINGAAVEIYSSAGALLGQATSAGTNINGGNYSLDVATGGVAPTIYRKTTAAGFLDHYANDPHAVSEIYPYMSQMQTAAARDSYYQLVGKTADPGRGTLQLFFYDCAPGGVFVAGITVDPPEGSTAIYFDDAYELDPSLTATTSSGQVLLLNVAAGSVDVAVHAGGIDFRPHPIVVHAGAWNEAIDNP